MPRKDVYTWNSMVSAYVRSGRFREAVDCFSQFLVTSGLRPDFYTFPPVLKACGNLNVGKKIHSWLIKLGLEWDVFVAASLIHMYSRFGLISVARKLFDEMPSRDMGCWNAMISGFCQNGNAADALGVLIEMRSEGVKMDPITVASLLTACAQSDDSLSGILIHLYVVKHGLEFDQFVCNALINMYAKFGCLGRAQRIFYEMEDSTMLKQILSKFPRKPKSESLDSTGSDSGNKSPILGSGFQCTIGGSSLTSKLNVVKRVSSAVFPASIAAGAEVVEPHLSFKEVSNPQKQNLFISKLNVCCEIIDSSDPVKQDLKRETLIELVDFVSSGSAKFTEPAISAMCKMCATNLFRVFPPKYRSNFTGGETEDEEPMFDPAWSHLQIVYDLLVRFISYSSLDIKVAKKHVDHSFIVRLLDLFDSEDPRERDCLKTILHRIYGKFMVHRPFIRKAVSNIIYRFVFETEKHNGMSELLEIFGSVISGFALPLKEEHKIFLWRALIPLHKPKSVGIYHQQLTYCVVQFIEKDPKLASTVIKGLLKYWPVTNSQKELMFLSELEEVLEMTSMDEFQKIMVPLFRRIRCCLNSSHYQVAERAHLLWNNEHILNLIGHNRQVILPLVFPAIERNTQNHWNQAVLNLTMNVRKMFCEMDEELVLACQCKLEEEHIKSNSAAEKRRITWERLETAAGVQPVVACNFLAPIKPSTCPVVC
ncbi:hypothetical protein ACLB2K_002822 [Fragaria x ananassa]